MLIELKQSTDRVQPATPDPHHLENHHIPAIPRDFRRLWSPEQLEALEQWRKEEVRIEIERQQRERVFMAFEDAIAYIVNERPRGMLDDIDIDPEDLVDDGHDDEDNDGGNDAGGSDASPWGVLPPAPIEILPNGVIKPEIPRGEVVHADMAGYFRIVEQLISAWQLENVGSDAKKQLPFLWGSIFPQDARGFPIYNPGGKYSVKLFLLGKWRCIDIDDRLPVDTNSHIVYATSSVPNEIWPALLSKAIVKAMLWLQVPVNETASSDLDLFAARIAAQTVLLLTGWKVSRWHPGAATSFSENVYQQLLPFIPRPQQQDVCVSAADGETFLGQEKANTHELQLPVDEVVELECVESAVNGAKPLSLMQPRALICCANPLHRGSSPLHFCEAAVLLDVVGDAGNTTFKLMRHGTLTSISEEVAGPASNQFVLLLAHPPPKHTATSLYTWFEGVREDKSDVLESLSQFENPPAQFAIVHLRKKNRDGDDQDSNDFLRANIVATLTPVYRRHLSVDNAYSRVDASATVATLLHQDPRGCMSLIEEPTEGYCQGEQGRTTPTLVMLDSVASSYLELTPKHSMRAFRVHPQKPLVRFGYCLELESNSVESIELVDAGGFWRALGHLHVEETRGVYPVMLANTWNVITQQVMTVDPDERNEQHDALEVRVSFHVSDAELARLIHVRIVNNTTNATVVLPALCCSAHLAVLDHKEAASLTVVVDCAAGSHPIRTGSWSLTIACSRKFILSSQPAVPIVVTSFGGIYEPNRGLVLFRDVVTLPAKASAVSFLLELYEIDDDQAERERLVEELAVRLEVFESSTNSGDVIEMSPVADSRGMGAVQLLQLPRPGSWSTARLILQGRIDRSTCNIPTRLESRQPFRNNTAQPIPPPPVADTSIQEIKGADTPAETTSNVKRGTQPTLEWRLRCFSSDDIKLDVDRTKELRHEAVHAQWAEQARDRETSGAASRLLFLGQQEAGEARLQQEPSLSEERVAAVHGRFTWLRSTLDQVEASERKFLVTSAAGDKSATLLTQEDLERHEQELATQLVVVNAQLQERRAAREAAKEDRAAQWKADVQKVVEERAAAAKVRAARRQDLLDASRAA